jgi:hypothetical protein
VQVSSPAAISHRCDNNHRRILTVLSPPERWELWSRRLGPLPPGIILHWPLESGRSRPSRQGSIRDRRPRLDCQLAVAGQHAVIRSQS